MDLPDLNRQWMLVIAIAFIFVLFFLSFSFYESVTGGGEEPTQVINGFESTKLLSDSVVVHFSTTE